MRSQIGVGASTGLPGRPTGVRLMASRTVSIRTRSGSLPSLDGHSFLGALPSFARDPLGTLARAGRQGDVVYLQMGPSRCHVPAYLVGHPDGVRRVLATGQQVYRKSFTSLPARSIFGLGLLTSDGPAWVAQRRLVRPLFHPDRMAPVAEVTAQASAALARRWRGYARSGEVIDVTAEMARVSLEVLLRSIFGVPLEERDADDISSAFAVLSQESWRRTASLAWWLFPRSIGTLPPARARRFRAATATLDRVVRRLAAAHDTDGPAGRPGDAGAGSLLSLLLEARDDDGRPLPWSLVRDEIATFLVAGHETTAVSMAWAWYLLTRDPQRHRLLAEAAGEPQQEYARAVMQESLRLYPPAWSIVRDAVADDEIGGCPIRAGSVVITAPYVTQRDPRFFEAPEEFRPERFLAGEPVPFTYFPFGGGGRRCVGERLALAQATAIVSALATGFRLRLTDPAPVPAQPAVTLRPGRPILMRVAAR